jgi:cytochrome c oxidase subunit 1/cytochrome c oxidase subunit I+III
MILEMPKDSFAPLILAVGTSVLFVGLLLKSWAVIAPGVAIAVVALLMWLWPQRDLRERAAGPGTVEPTRG